MRVCVQLSNSSSFLFSSRSSFQIGNMEMTVPCMVEGPSLLVWRSVWSMDADSMTPSKACCICCSNHRPYIARILYILQIVKRVLEAVPEVSIAPERSLQQSLEESSTRQETWATRGHDGDFLMLPTHLNRLLNKDSAGSSAWFSTASSSRQNRHFASFNGIGLRTCPYFFLMYFLAVFLITLLDLDVIISGLWIIIAQRKRRNHASDRFLESWRLR